MCVVIVSCRVLVWRSGWEGWLEWGACEVGACLSDWVEGGREGERRVGWGWGGEEGGEAWWGEGGGGGGGVFGCAWREERRDVGKGSGGGGEREEWSWCAVYESWITSGIVSSSY